MVLNRVNKSLVQMVEKLGVHAVGISGKDGGLLKVQKRISGGKDLGFVGEITEVNPKVIMDLLEKDFLPIICPIGYDDNYDSYNINADDAACAIASAVHAEKLAFLTDTEGVFRVFEDKDSFIPTMTVTEAAGVCCQRSGNRWYASEADELHPGAEGWRIPCTYPGRTYRSLPAA